MKGPHIWTTWWNECSAHQQRQLRSLRQSVLGPCIGSPVSGRRQLSLSHAAADVPLAEENSIPNVSPVSDPS